MVDPRLLYTLTELVEAFSTVQRVKDRMDSGQPLDPDMEEEEPEDL